MQLSLSFSASLALSTLASSLCVNPPVSNPLPVRLTETSTFIYATLCLASSRGCLPLPLLSLILSIHPSILFFSSLNHFRPHSNPPWSLHSSVLSFTHSYPLPSSVFHLLCPPSGPPSRSHSVHSLYLLRGQCSVLAALHPPSLGGKINKRPHVPKEF